MFQFKQNIIGPFSLSALFLSALLIASLYRGSYNKNSIFRIFFACAATLLFFILIVYEIEHRLSPNNFFEGISFMFYGYFIIIYSFVYSQINRLYRFSLKHAITFNSIAGIFFIINALTLQRKIDIGFYLVFALFLSIQLAISLYYKKIAQRHVGQ